MKNNKGFTLIELLAVIVVLAIVMVLAATTVLPYMANARETAFKTEATSVVKAAETAKDLYTLGQITIPTTSCVSSTKMCFKVDDLIGLGIYDAEAATFDGTVTITNLSATSPTYTLNFKKNDEFKIVGGTGKDYSNYAGSLNATWADANNTCSCSS